MNLFGDRAAHQQPDHPDFWRMSNVILRHDGQVTEGDDSVGDVINEYVDEKSLIYVGEQRLMRVGVTRNHPQFVILLGLYIDAFVLGAGYQKEGGARDA